MNKISLKLNKNNKKKNLVYFPRRILFRTVVPNVEKHLISPTGRDVFVGIKHRSGSSEQICQIEHRWDKSINV